MRRRRDHRQIPTVVANQQLNLYRKMFRGDFLHYGYFDDIEVAPEAVSFEDLYQAQYRYAEQILELIALPGAPVLDVGSGMGGMLGLLAARRFDVTGLTPDRYQVEHLREAYADVPVIHSRFEDMPTSDSGGRFGTIIHAESIQYQQPDRVFEVVRRALRPQGTWIVADYFRETSVGERSGWQWAGLEERIAAEGFVLTHYRDITRNVLPTLGFLHLLANRIGLPVFDFVCDKIEAKRPAAHYVIENILRSGREEVLGNIDKLDPEIFAARKRYVLMAMRPA